MNIKRLAIWVFIMICSACLIASAEDPTANPYDRKLEPAKSFHAARDHLKAGEYEKALIIHEWMFDHIESLRPEVFFLHVHNLTYDWHQVAKNHPPAMKALLARREKSESALRASVAHLDAEPEKSLLSKITFREVTAFNEWLEEDAKSVALYEEIKGSNPKLARSWYFYVRDSLLRAKRFDLIAEREPSPTKAVESCATVYKAMIQTRPDLQSYAEDKFVRNITDYIDIYTAVGLSEKAEEVRTLSLQIVDSPKIRNHEGAK